MRYPVQRAGLSTKMREVGWLAEGRTEGEERREGGRICFCGWRDPVLWDNGIPFSSRGSALTREVLVVSYRVDLENKTGSTDERWISINVDPAAASTFSYFSPCELIRRHRCRLS